MSYPMSSRYRLHTATALLLSTASLCTRAFLFDRIGEQMAQHHVLRLGIESGSTETEKVLQEVH